MGISETTKLINVLKNDVIELLSLDYELIGKELSELDAEEKKELLIEIGGAIIQILAAINMSKASGMIFSKVFSALS